MIHTASNPATAAAVSRTEMAAPAVGVPESCSVEILDQCVRHGESLGLSVRRALPLASGAVHESMTMLLIGLDDMIRCSAEAALAH